MQIRNRLIPLIYRMAASAGTLVALIFYVTALGPAWRALSLCSVQIGYALAVVLVFETIFNAIDMRHGIRGMAAGFYMPFKLPLVVFCMTAGLLYFIDTIVFYPIEFGAQGLIYHAVLLLVPLIDYLLFDEKGTVKWYQALSAMLYPTLYLAFVWARPIIWPDAELYNGSSGMYPYIILNPRNDFFLLGSVGGFLALAAILVGVSFLNDVLAGKYRNREPLI